MVAQPCCPSPGRSTESKLEANLGPIWNKATTKRTQLKVHRVHRAVSLAHTLPYAPRLDSKYRGLVPQWAPSCLLVALPQGPTTMWLLKPEDSSRIPLPSISCTETLVPDLERFLHSLLRATLRCLFPFSDLFPRSSASKAAPLLLSLLCCHSSLSETKLARPQAHS